MPETRDDIPHYEPDIVVLLVLMPLISAFNYSLNYRHIQFYGFLLLTFDTMQAYEAFSVLVSNYDFLL